jgi:hypothetical protein
VCIYMTLQNIVYIYIYIWHYKILCIYMTLQNIVYIYIWHYKILCIYMTLQNIVHIYDITKYCVYIWHYKLQIKLLALKINLLYLNKIIPILTLCLSSCLCVISIELTLRALWDISLKDVCNNHFSLSCWASWKSKWSWYALSNFATIS